MTFTKTLTFYECEHEGDLDQYAEDVTRSGGKILRSWLSDDGETGHIKAEFTDASWEKFKTTEAAEFLN